MRSVQLVPQLLEPVEAPRAEGKVVSAFGEEPGHALTEAELAPVIRTVRRCGVVMAGPSGSVRDGWVQW